MINITESELKKIVKDSVLETFTLLGIQHTNPVEMQKDFAHLRRWRGAVDTAQSTGFLAAIGILTSGLLAALWLGVKESFRQ